MQGIVSEVIEQNNITESFTTNNYEGISKADILINNMIEEGLLCPHTRDSLVCIINIYMPNANADKDGNYTLKD